MHFQWGCPEKAQWSCPGNPRGRHRRGGRGGAGVKREGWERKPMTNCVHAAISHLWAQNKKRSFHSPREEAVCSGRIRGYLHCWFRPLVHLLGKWYPWRKRSHFPEHLCPNECCPTDAAFQLCCLPTISLFSPLAIFNMLACPGSKLKCLTLFFIRKVCLQARSVFQLGSLFLLTSNCTSELVWRN